MMNKRKLDDTVGAFSMEQQVHKSYANVHILRKI